jgi:predicted nuclease with TOPRIM domain
MQFEEAPCKINEVISMNYSFDNLHKFLNYLMLNDKDYFQKLQNIRIKLLELDDVKENLRDIKEKNAVFDQKFTQMEGTLVSFHNKFSELDSKISMASSVKNFKNKIFNFKINLI